MCFLPKYVFPPHNTLMKWENEQGDGEKGGGNNRQVQENKGT